MACALQKKGHEVLLLTLSNTELFTKSEQQGIRVIAIKISNLSFLNPFSVFSIQRLLRKEKPAALILNFSADVKTVGIAARLAGIRNIIYRRGNARALRNTAFNRFLYNRIVSKIIVNSKETGNSLLKNNHKLVPQSKIKVIYNGIDIQNLDQQKPDKLYRKQSDEIVIGTAGRLSGEKGHFMLLEMACELRNLDVRFVILIAGEGSLGDELKRKVNELGLEGSVVFTGFVKNIRDLMDAIDIFVLPSLWEGFGYVTVEAMACNKPVVAFHVGSNPEIIADQETGFLVKPYDVKELANRVALLGADRQLASSMGTSGRKRAVELFDIERSVNEFEAFLKGI